MNARKAKPQQIYRSIRRKARLFQPVQIHDKADTAGTDSLRPEDADTTRLDLATQRVRRVRDDPIILGTAIFAPDNGAIIGNQACTQRHELQCQR